LAGSDGYKRQPIFYLLKKSGNSKFKSVLASMMRNPIGPLSVSAFFIAEVLIVKPQVFAMYANNWHGFFYGFLAFFFGFLFVFSGAEFWQTVKKWKWGYIGVGAILYVIRWQSSGLIAPNYLMAIESNCWILGVFGLAYQYLNKPSALLNYLSQSVYPVYIIHMFVLYLGSSIILPLELDTSIKFVSIVAFTFMCCYLIFELILRRVEVIKPFFGMRGSASLTSSSKTNKLKLHER